MKTAEVRAFTTIERKIWSGVVLEREIFNIAPRTTLPHKTAEPRLRFQSEEDRKKHRDNMARKRHERMVNANFRPGDLYLTLTFDEKNECHNYEECWTLLRRYIRRIMRVYKNAVLFYYCGRGENTNRFHVHILAAGVPERFMVQKWGYGKIEDVQKLWAHCLYEGVDCGPCYTKLANYLFDHWEPEQGPHRYHHTRNAAKPEADPYQPVRRKYSEEHPPKAPKGYKLIEVKTTRYGYMNFKYVKEPGEAFLDFDKDIRKPKRSRNRRTRTERKE